MPTPALADQETARPAGRIVAPVLIIGCPRSGTSLLYNVLSEAPSLWSIGYESKAIIERFHSPARKNWDSGVLTAGDLTPETAAAIRADFYRRAVPGSAWRAVNRLRARLRASAAWQAVK
ncbi:MAG: sulfotransferase, partial [Candidatus Promineifilaceae bacterium]